MVYERLEDSKKNNRDSKAKINFLVLKTMLEYM